MNNSTKQKAIILHLSPKINRIASRIVPFDEFLQFSQAVLEDICQKTIAFQPDLPAKKIRDIVFEDTVLFLASAAANLLDALRSGKTEGRVTLSVNDKSFLIDLRSELSKE